jgi:hypothetical protein
MAFQTDEKNGVLWKILAHPSTWKYATHKTHSEVELLCSCILTS